MGSVTETGGAARETFATDIATSERAEPTMTIYENEIPSFVERQLEQLYECIYCTLARLNIHDRTANASTYVVRNGATIITVFLFRQDGDEIKVLNQQAAISEEEIRRFAGAVFSRYASARIISFYAVDTKLNDLPFPFQTYGALDENVLFPPATAEEFLASMSANFRGGIRRAERRIKKRFPSFRFEMFSTGDVSEDLVREIIRMAGARMAVKQKKAYISEDSLDNLMRLIRTHGHIGVATIDGKVCGGSVWYRVGGRSFLHIIAHDPEYDQYKLGNQTLLMGIVYWIGHGVRECWLMGGGVGHKSRFLAVPRSLESIIIYRSRLALLFHWRRASAATAKSLTYRVRQQVRLRANGGGALARFVRWCLKLGRSFKRLGHARA